MLCVEPRGLCVADKHSASALATDWEVVFLKTEGDAEPRRKVLPGQRHEG